MRFRLLRRAGALFVLFAIALSQGCGAPKPCTVTPVDVEETKADLKDVEADLVIARQRLERAQTELAGWVKRLDEKKGQPAILRANLERLKKASGRTEKADEEKEESREIPEAAKKFQ